MVLTPVIQTALTGTIIPPRKGHHGGGEDDEPFDRWLVTASYRTNREPFVRSKLFEEIDGEAFGQWIERGPNWVTLIQIVVNYAGPADYPMVLSDEEVERLKALSP